jgi:hypothetical protein
LKTRLSSFRGVLPTAVAVILVLTLTFVFLSNTNWKFQNSVTLYKTLLVKDASFQILTLSMFIPEENFVFTSIFDLALLKPLMFFFSPEYAFGFSNLVCIILLGFLFYFFVNHYLKKKYSFFLTLLLLSTPTSGTFQENLETLLNGQVRSYGFFFLENSSPTRIVLVIAAYLWVYKSEFIDLKRKHTVLSYLTLLSVLVHPISGLICLLLGFIRKSQILKNGVVHSKANQLLVVLAGCLFGAQSFSIIKALVGENRSVIGGLSGNVTLDYPIERTFFYFILPIVLLLMSTRIINISWYEIRKRFGFLFLLFAVQGISLTLYYLGSRNLLDVLYRNGLIFFISIASYIPVIYVYSQIARINKLLLLPLKHGKHIVGTINFLPQFVSVLLILVLVVTSAFTIRNHVGQSDEACDNRSNNYSVLLQKYFSNLELNNLTERDERTVEFISSNLTGSETNDFLSNPLSTETPAFSPQCIISGAGYLYVNGFDQSRESTLRIQAIKMKLMELENN